MRKSVMSFLTFLSVINLYSVDPYALGVGEKASRRLDFQHNLIGKDSIIHLWEAGLRKDIVFLDIGCGNGILTIWIASQIGDQGKVIAVDKSPDLIEVARKRAQALSLNNIDFICGDITELDFPKNTIDMIYCRCLLMHLKEPLKVVDKLYSVLKTGGTFACQEPINSSSFLYPENNHLIAKLNYLFRNISLQHGVDYDIGNKLHAIFIQAGCRSMQLHFSQRSVPIGIMKGLLLQFLEDVNPSGLKEEINEIHAIIKAYPENEGSYYVLPKQAHLTVYKE